MDLYTIILAAGKGKRMGTDLPKVILKLRGVPMIEKVITAANQLHPKKTVLVIGYKGDMVQEATKNFSVDYVWQREQLGTGHAVAQTEPLFKGVEGCALVLYGDTPLITSSTLDRLYHYHLEQNAYATVLTAVVENPFGYGRIIRNNAGDISKIVEEKDASEEEKKVREINSGMYIFNVSHLFDGLKKIDNHNAQHEYFLPDVINVFIKEGKKVSAFISENSNEILGANTVEQLDMLDGI